MAETGDVSACLGQSDRDCLADALPAPVTIAISPSSLKRSIDSPPLAQGGYALNCAWIKRTPRKLADSPLMLRIAFDSDARYAGSVTTASAACPTPIGDVAADRMAGLRLAERRLLLLADRTDLSRAARVWNTQPDGGLVALGISPSRRMRAVSVWSSLGTADSSASV